MRQISINKRSQKLSYRSAYFLLREKGYTMSESSYSYEKEGPEFLEWVMFRTKYGTYKKRPLRTFYLHIQKLSRYHCWVEEYDQKKGL